MPQPRTTEGYLQWLADRPYDTWIGRNPEEGGYSCIVDLEVRRLSWGVKKSRLVEGQGDTPLEAIIDAYKKVSVT